MSQPITIGIVDDQLLFQQALGNLLEQSERFTILFRAGNGEDCLRALTECESLPSLILIDLEMPGMNGLLLQDTLHQRYPSIKTIVLSVHSSARLMSRMIQSGASGFLSKNCDQQELLTTLQQVHETGFYITETVVKALQTSFQHKYPLRDLTTISIELTRREKEVLRLICSEKSTPEIAAALYVSERTVEGHRQNLLAKTGCRNVAGLVVFAIKNGLTEAFF
jgi:DNA-binding NarL/FixJ family response regulator